MYGEETDANEKKDYGIQKIPKFSDEAIESEQLNDEIKEHIMDTHSKIENIISNREIVDFYINASPTERVELENTIISSNNNGSAFIAYLKEEARKHDLATDITKTINSKLK